MIEQYSQGHLSLTNKVNQVQFKMDELCEQLNRQQLLFNNLGMQKLPTRSVVVNHFLKRTLIYTYSNFC